LAGYAFVQRPASEIARHRRQAQSRPSKLAFLHASFDVWQYDQAA
jgi:hypothetical protein